MGRPAIQIELEQEQLDQLRQFYRETKSARERTRAQIVLLAAEQGLGAPQIAPLVHMCEQTVRNWLRRYQQEGIDGFADRPRCGAPGKVTDAYIGRLLEVVRHRPRALGLSFSTWSLEKLTEFLANETGIEVSDETVRRHLAANGIVLRRPQHKISSPDPLYRVKKCRSNRCGKT